MKIAIDISQVNRDRAGINHYLVGLLKGLLAHSEHEYLLYARREEDLGFRLPENFRLVVLPSKKSWQGGGFAWYKNAAKDMKVKGVDILVVATMNVAPLFFEKTIMIIHDLAPITFPDTINTGARWRYRIATWLTAKKAWKVAAVTEYTKREFLQLFPGYEKEVAVTNEGLNEWVLQQVFEEDKTKVREQYGLPDKFLLSLSTLQPRKNYIRMIRAFAKLAKTDSELHYVIIGSKGWYFEEILNAVHNLDIADKVHFLGFVPEDHLAPIFDQARALAMVSLEEGFGLPIIEARARALPVVCSDIPVFRELKLDDQVVFANPGEVDDIARAMSAALSKGLKVPSKEFFSTYNWNSVANKIAGMFLT